MQFSFTCELCKKEVKSGDHFNLDIFKKEDDSMSNGHACLDDVCKSCTNKITRKIDSLRK